MLKLILTYLSQATWARKVVQNWGFAKRTAARFVAGESLDDAIQVVKQLQSRGIYTTLDHLGEHVHSEEEALLAADEIIKIMDRFKQDGVRSGISVKLTQIGLSLDHVVCYQNLIRILDKARQEKTFIRIDMEESALTEITLDLYSRALQDGYADLIGIVIQSCLYRSEEDVKRLMAESSKVRICKGAYKETRQVAYPKKEDVDRNFDRITELLLDRSLTSGDEISQDGSFPPIPAIATHDSKRIEHALDYAERISLSKQGLEFQMLHGIRGDLQNQLNQAGYPVRVYVPYGSEWYPYFVRRLAERPANLWFFISNLFRG
jgi:proline dehydrogenase